MVYRHDKTGWIEVICGGMFSGKTEELIRRLRRAQIAKQRIQIFKHSLDDRYSESQIISHSDQQLHSQPVDSSNKMLELLDDNTRVVGIDEGQFFDEELVNICQKMANRGIRVIIAGLDTDFHGNPFGPMPNLMAIAESVTKQSAICIVCGEQACRSQKLSTGDSTIEVGSSDIYEARCRHCFIPGGTKQSTTNFVTATLKQEGSSKEAKI